MDQEVWEICFVAASKELEYSRELEGRVHRLDREFGCPEVDNLRHDVQSRPHRASGLLPRGFQVSLQES